MKETRGAWHSTAAVVDRGVEGDRDEPGERRPSRSKLARSSFDAELELVLELDRSVDRDGCRDSSSCWRAPSRGARRPWRRPCALRGNFPSRIAPIEETLAIEAFEDEEEERGTGSNDDGDDSVVGYDEIQRQLKCNLRVQRSV